MLWKEPDSWDVLKDFVGILNIFLVWKKKLHVIDFPNVYEAVNHGSLERVIFTFRNTLSLWIMGWCGEKGFLATDDSEKPSDWIMYGELDIMVAEK